MPESEHERTTVTTYAPRYQKERWSAHAERLDMSLSEFVRTMVQAGRRGFDPSTPEGASSSPDSGGKRLEDRVADVLSQRGSLSWDELVAEVSGDVEARLDDALQSSDRIRYSGRADGYVLHDE